MPDREKVIKHFEHLLNAAKGNYQDFVDLTVDAGEEILDLLKEQEPVEPKKVKGYNPPMYTFYEYECKECKSPMMNKQPFCMGCGRPVKW